MNILKDFKKFAELSRYNLNNEMELENFKTDEFIKDYEKFKELKDDLFELKYLSLFIFVTFFLVNILGFNLDNYENEFFKIILALIFLFNALSFVVVIFAIFNILGEYLKIKKNRFLNKLFVKNSLNELEDEINIEKKIITKKLLKYRKIFNSKENLKLIYNQKKDLEENEYNFLCQLFENFENKTRIEERMQNEFNKNKILNM